MFGDKDNFKIFYNNLRVSNFPMKEIKTFYLFESNRWDLELINNKMLRLPINNYNQSLKNFIEIKDQLNFEKYKTFDYRIKDQLILKFMQSPILFVEINKYEYIFIAGEINENGNFRLVENNIIPIEGINDNKITNLEKVSQIIRENIYSIEQKLNFIFKEVILIINNFDCLLINFSGFKNLNGSQLEKDNITYFA